MEDIYNTPSKLSIHSGYHLRTKYAVKPSNTSQGNQSDVFLITTPDEKITTFAVKKQYIKSPHNKKDRVYREFQILWHLSQLKHCNNFVSLVDWFKSGEELQLQHNVHSQLDTNATSGKNTTSREQFLYFVLEYAGCRLFDLKDKLTVSEYKSILFQILFALYIAQEELEFVHNDLHLKNVLLQSLPQDQCNTHKDVFQGDNSCWYTQFYMVKLIDFGHSRIRIKRPSSPSSQAEEIIYNPKNPLTENFDSGHDVRKIAESFKLKTSLFSQQQPQDGEENKDTQETDQEKRAYLDLRRKMCQGTAPAQLIKHKFFESLRQKPTRTSTLSIASPSPHNRISFVSPLGKESKRELVHRTEGEQKGMISSTLNPGKDEDKENRPYAPATTLKELQDDHETNLLAEQLGSLTINTSNSNATESQEQEGGEANGDESEDKTSTTPLTSRSSSLTSRRRNRSPPTTPLRSSTRLRNRQQSSNTTRKATTS